MKCACAILSTVTCPALPDFSTSPYKWCEFRENVLEHKMRVFILFTNLSEIFLTLKRIQRDIINSHRSARKVAVNLVRF